MKGSTREALLSALYASVAERPAWVGFAACAQRIFASDQAAVIVHALAEGAALRLGGYARPDLTAPIEQLFDGPACDFPLQAVTGVAVEGGAALLLPVADQQGYRATIVVWRGAGAPPFDAAAEALLASLAEALQRSLGIYHRVTDLTRRVSVADAALETSRIGIILAGAEGDVILTNAIADAIIARGDGLVVARGRVAASVPAETELLLDEIRRRAAEQSAVSNWQAYAPMSLSRAERTLPLTLVVRPGPAFHPMPNPLRRTAMLILRDPEEPRAVPAATFAQLFGLSPAEAQLASALARGSSLDQAALELSVSRNTLRTQLQSIFLKTGVNRQTDLIRILLSSAAASI